MLGFLDNADRLVVGIEFHDAIPLGVVHVIPEHRGALLNGGRLAQLASQTIAIEDVVAEHKRARVAVDELLTKQKGLRQAVGAGLHLVAQRDAVLRTVAEQTLEVRQVLWRGDD